MRADLHIRIVMNFLKNCAANQIPCTHISFIHAYKNARYEGK